MRYVFNEKIGNGFVIISADDLILHARDSRYGADSLDSLRECKEAQQELHERGIRAIIRCIKGGVPERNALKIFEEYKERQESFQEFRQYHSGDFSKEIKIVYWGPVFAPKVMED